MFVHVREQLGKVCSREQTKVGNIRKYKICNPLNLALCSTNFDFCNSRSKITL